MPVLSKSQAIGFNQPHGGDIKAIAAYLDLDPKGLIDFSANINPFGPPAELTAALDTSTASIRNYPEVNAEGFLEALAGRSGIDPNCLLAGNGSAELLYWLFAWLKPRRVLLIEPGFSDYRRAAQANGSEIISLCLREEDGFALDWALFERALKPADVVVVGRPNNPIGSMLDGNLLCGLAHRRPDTVFLIDEAFIDFVEPPASLAHHATRFGNLIVLRSLTKIFSIPGIRLGYIVAHRKRIARMALARPPWPLGAVQIAAGLAAAQLKEFVESSCRRLTDERHWLTARLSEAVRLKPFESEANFILMKILDPNMTGTLLMLSLAKLGVYIRDCRSFKGLNDKYIRTAVRSREDNERLVDALKEAL